MGDCPLTLADAIQIATLPLPHIAARDAYLAVFHATEAYIFEHTGKVAKTHRGEFARLPRNEPCIGRGLTTFLGTAYQFKTTATTTTQTACTPPAGHATVPSKKKPGRLK